MQTLFFRVFWAFLAKRKRHRNQSL